MAKEPSYVQGDFPHQSEPVIHESRTYGCQSAERRMQPVAPKSIFCSAIQRLPISRASLISLSFLSYFCIQTSRSNDIWSGSPWLLCALFLDVQLRWMTKSNEGFKSFSTLCFRVTIIVCVCACACV